MSILIPLFISFMAGFSTLIGVIPIFIKMFSLKELSIVKRIVVPSLAIVSSVFMIIAAIYSHKWGVLYFLIITIIIMLIGNKFVKKVKN